jgi:hypothetical protein
MVQKSREYYVSIIEELGRGTKLDFAYTYVADNHNVSAATVRRAYQRISAFIDGPGALEPEAPSEPS